MATKATTKKAERAVVVTTEHRGVFFGYATNTSGKTIKLRGARNAYYWKCTGGILELGESGPKEGSRIGARADIELRNITAVIECTPAAITAWKKARWEN